MNGPLMSARALTRKDVGLIADYWSLASVDYLRGMGVDPRKFPSRADFAATLIEQLEKPLRDRSAYYTVWESDGKPIGHSNVNKIVFGHEAYMHLHLWNPDERHRGWGVPLVRRSLALFFEQLELRDVFCEPYDANPAPHRVLEKAGFEFVRSYVTVPGPINFRQTVRRWHMRRASFEAMRARSSS